jgi:hypothetical protein
MNKKTRSAQRHADQAAIGETIDSEVANLIPEMDTMEVATSDNEHTPKRRKRQRNQAAAGEEEEDAAPAPGPRGRRSQSSASPEDTTYSGPQNQTEQDAAPTSPDNDEGEARVLARAAKQRRNAQRADFQQRAQVTIDIRARRQLERLETEMAASLQLTQAPTDGSGNFLSASAGRPQSREKSSAPNGSSSGSQPLSQ